MRNIDFNFENPRNEIKIFIWHKEHKKFEMHTDIALNGTEECLVDINLKKHETRCSGKILPMVFKLPAACQSNLNNLYRHDRKS